MRETFALVVLAPWVVFAFEAVAEPSRYGKALQQACTADYKKYCGEYGIKARRCATAWTRTGTA